MDEKRKYFRVKNNGQILSQYHSHPLNIIELSYSGAIIQKDDSLPQKGSFEIKIHQFSTTINYEVIRVDSDSMALAFTNDHEMEHLFLALKNLRNQKKQTL